MANIDKILSSIQRDKEHKNSEIVDKYLKDNDLTELVGPYVSNQETLGLLKWILGQKQVDNITGLNALVYSGIINTSCPPPNAPDRTEEYINVLTGRKECREPIPKRKQLNSLDKCENAPFTEKYIDFFGKAHCDRPVLSGAFSCPPKGDPTKIKRIVLKNNVGVCVEDPVLMPSKRKFIMPAQLVFYDDEVNGKMANMLKYLNQMRFSNDILLKMGNILRDNRSLGDIKSGLSGDPEYEMLAIIADNLHKPADVHMAKSTYMHYLLNNNPDLATSILNIDDKDAINMETLKNFLGVEITE